MSDLDPRARDVLDFWFGAPGSPDHGKERELWFTKRASTDEEIRRRFAALIDSALGSELDAWRSTPRGTLALIVLLDQFTRNVFRDTPRAFAGDAQALALASALVERGDDRQLSLHERAFAYLPFEHAESMPLQDQAVALFTKLADDGYPGPLQWAIRHRDVIVRFGRFPHRNEILRRASSPEELAFLQQPGSRF